MSKKKKSGRRIFLSPDVSRTAFAAWRANTWGRRTDVTLEIADCTRKVTLAFDVGTSAKTRKAALLKLRRLSDILVDVREYLERM